MARVSYSATPLLRSLVHRPQGVILVFKGKIWVFAARPGPTRPHHALQSLISQEPHVWSTSGLLWWIPLGCKSCMTWLPYCVSPGHGTWRVPNLGFLGRPPKHFTSITAQRVGRLRWNLVCTWGPISYSLCSSQGWGISARAHVHTPLLYLENDWTDCADIWHVASGQLVMRLPHVYGGVTMHVRTCTPHFYISGTAEPIALRFGI